MAITEQPRRPVPGMPPPARPAGPRQPDPALKLAAQLADEQGRAARLESRLSELQEQVKTLTAAAAQKDSELGEAAQALRQSVTDRQAFQNEALALLEKTKEEARLYRFGLAALVQIGDNPSLLLGDALGRCVQGARRAIAAYPERAPTAAPAAKT